MSQIEELRQIIVGDNAEQLGELKARIEDIDRRTRDVAEVLPPAIRQGIRQDNQLIEALQNPVSESLKSAIRREPAEYADILYPVMSPAIRRAISQAISSLLATINQTVESATSVKGLKMRFESIRTGIPYAELALRKTLLYRVEHVYLIERDSGLLIAELANQDVSSLDSDAVSAMFSAIQSFVQDSFSQNTEDRLTDLAVGEHKVWVVHGPKAMLACVIRGDAPASLKTQLYDVLDSIRTRYAQQLSDFDGSAEHFVGIEDELRPCLQLELKEPTTVNRVPLGTVLLGVLLFLGALYFAYQYTDKKLRLDRLRTDIQNTPGYVVTNAKWQDEKVVVEGLMDPDAKIDSNLLDKHHLTSDGLVLNMKPYRSMERELVLKRIRVRNGVADSVDMQLQGDKLVLRGEANMDWLQAHSAKLGGVEGINQVDMSGIDVVPESLYAFIDQRVGVPENIRLDYQNKELLVSGRSNRRWLASLKTLFVDSPWVKQVKAEWQIDANTLIKAIDNAKVTFATGAASSDSVASVVRAVAKDFLLLQQVVKPGTKVALYVQANVDSLGDATINQALQNARYQKAVDLLMSHDVPNQSIRRNSDNHYPQMIQNERSIRFKAVLQGAQE